MRRIPIPSLSMQVYQKESDRRSQRGELGAAIVMVYLAILMFLYMAILFLDIPYIERIGRSMQRAADAAALAGSIQLTRRTAWLDPPTNTIPDVAERRRGWTYAKRAVAATLKANTIASLDPNLFFTATPVTAPPIPAGTTTTEDPLDLMTGYGYESYNFNSTQTAVVTITRGVYERPAVAAGDPCIPAGSAWANNKQTFYPSEIGDDTRTLPGPISTNNCIPTAGALGVPTSCRCPIANPPIEDVADSVQVTITINGIPTLFGKLMGFNSFTSITRTALSVPQ